jgi:hypothetical protein
LGKVIGRELVGLVSLVTLENPSWPQILETPVLAQTSKAEDSKITTVQGINIGVLALVMITQD